MKTYNEFKENMYSEVGNLSNPEVQEVEKARSALAIALWKLTVKELQPIKHQTIKALGELNSAIYGRTSSNGIPLPQKGLPSNLGNSVTVGPWGT